MNLVSWWLGAAMDLRWPAASSHALHVAIASHVVHACCPPSASDLLATPSVGSRCRRREGGFSPARPPHAMEDDDVVSFVGYQACRPLDHDGLQLLLSCSRLSPASKKTPPGAAVALPLLGKNPLAAARHRWIWKRDGFWSLVVDRLGLLQLAAIVALVAVRRSHGFWEDDGAPNFGAPAVHG